MTFECTCHCAYVYSEKYISISFQIERNIIVMRVFLSILNSMEFHLVKNRESICHYDHISFNLNGNRNMFLWVHLTTRYFQQIFSSLEYQYINLPILTRKRVDQYYFNYLQVIQFSYYFNILRRQLKVYHFVDKV